MYYGYGLPALMGNNYNNYYSHIHLNCNNYIKNNYIVNIVECLKMLNENYEY